MNNLILNIGTSLKFKPLEKKTYYVSAGLVAGSYPTLILSDTRDLDRKDIIYTTNK